MGLERGGLWVWVLDLGVWASLAVDLGYWIQPVQCWIINYSEFRVEGTVFEGFLSGGFGSAFIGLFPGRDRLLAGL